MIVRPVPPVSSGDDQPHAEVGGGLEGAGLPGSQRFLRRAGRERTLPEISSLGTAWRYFFPVPGNLKTFRLLIVSSCLLWEQTFPFVFNMRRCDQTVFLWVLFAAHCVDRLEEFYHLPQQRCLTPSQPGQESFFSPFFSFQLLMLQIWTQVLQKSPNGRRHLIHLWHLCVCVRPAGAGWLHRRRRQLPERGFWAAAQQTALLGLGETEFRLRQRHLIQKATTESVVFDSKTVWTLIL